MKASEEAASDGSGLRLPWLLEGSAARLSSGKRAVRSVTYEQIVVFHSCKILPGDTRRFFLDFLILNFPIGLSSRVIFSFLPPSRASPRIWSTFGQLYSENGLRENPHETSTLGRKIGAGVKRTVLCWFSLKILKQSMDPQHCYSRFWYWVRSREVIMSTPIVIIHIFGYPITGIVSSDILFPSIFQQPNMAM